MRLAWHTWERRPTSMRYKPPIDCRNILDIPPTSCNICTLRSKRDLHFTSNHRLFIIMIFQSFNIFTSLLLVRSKLLQLVKRHLLERLLIRSVQEDLGNDLRTQWVVLVGIECFSPSTKLHGQSRTRIHAMFTADSQRQLTYLLTQRHHLQPPFMPGMGLRSLPCLALKSRNSSVTSAATAWLP